MIRKSGNRFSAKVMLEQNAGEETSCGAQVRKGGHKGTNWAEIRDRKRHERGRIALAAALPLALSGWVV